LVKAGILFLWSATAIELSPPQFGEGLIVGQVAASARAGWLPAAEGGIDAP
jgi:hypothetical protein